MTQSPMPRITRPIAVSAFALFVCAPVFADTYKAPRTSDGQPDLQGYWTNATLTPVERPTSLGEKLVLSEAEATAMEGQMARRMEAANAPSDPNEVQRAGQAVGGYNMFWADFGTRVAIVNGERPQLADRRSAARTRTDAASASAEAGECSGATRL